MGRRARGACIRPLVGRLRPPASDQRRVEPPTAQPDPSLRRFIAGQEGRMISSTPRILGSRLNLAVSSAAIGVALALGGCATITASDTEPSAEAAARPPSAKRAAFRDRSAEAYYHYAVAQ